VCQIHVERCNSAHDQQAPRHASQFATRISPGLGARLVDMGSHRRYNQTSYEALQKWFDGRTCRFQRGALLAFLGRILFWPVTAAVNRHRHRVEYRETWCFRIASQPVAADLRC
ncbi:MAG TPA: hypothetical protein DEP84_19855, partial [Chloroflexi bacterium]|nr:hypothetical protein [Chloroflexota bacterium]